MVRRDKSALDSEVDIDGCHVNSHVRQKNKKADRIDRSLAENQRSDKRCVFVMRNRADASQGAKRTLTFVVNNENQEVVKKLTGRFVKKGTINDGQKEN